MKSAQPEAKETSDSSLFSQTAPAHIIPDHELLERIGSGAYGEVWLARNVIGELRAVKIIYRSRFNDARPFEREFEGIRRFEPISRSHPSQLAILHVGKNDQAGCFYYIMELADAAQPGPNKRGRDVPTAPQTITENDGERRLPEDTLPYCPHTLRHDLDRCERLSIPDCIRIGLSLTTALARLHEHGLVHRDIKPSNVIFVNGVPKLGDIGLVTEAGDTQSIVGTEGYIPPEGPGTPQADIFSLGKVLYEISTGLDRRRFAELPEDLRSWPDCRGVVEFNEILLKACAKDAARRYQSADELRGDLDFLQRGRSVKRRRAWQRNRTRVVVSGLAVMAAVVSWQAIRRWPPTNSNQPLTPKFEWSTNEQANQVYRDGVQALHVAMDCKKALECFQRATTLDPNFAEAYARLAAAWYASGWNKGEGQLAARRAVNLNPKLALAHSMLATAHVGELNWAEADKEQNLAVSLNPNSEAVLLESSLNLAVMGRTNEALANLQRARRATPDSASRQREDLYGFVYAWCRQYDQALEVLEPLRNYSDFEGDQMARMYWAKGDYPSAIRIGKEGALASGENPDEVSKEYDALKRAYDDGGKDTYWRLMLEYENTRKNGRNHLMRMAAIHAWLNHPDDAFKFLKQAEQDDPAFFSIEINTNPSFDLLRSDHRFQEMIDKLWHKK